MDILAIHMKYFNTISKDTIALLYIIKKLLMYLTIGGALATASLELNPYVSLTILLIREGLGEFLKIIKTDALD